MIIPHQMLSPEALHGIIEAFVTREGTDDGTQDVVLATKVRQVRQQLDAGTAVIVYGEGAKKGFHRQSTALVTQTPAAACGMTEAMTSAR
jgi:uncharacterized protein YheU (UPF0270 family)